MFDMLSIVCRSRSLCILIVLAVIVIGVLDVGLLAREYVNHIHGLSTEDRRPSPSVCVSCELLTQAFSHDEQLTLSISSLSREWRGNVETCCAENSDQMSTIIALIGRKQTKVRAPVTYDPVNVTSGQVSVHKRLLPYHNMTTDTDQWFSERNMPLQLDNSENDRPREHANNVQVLPSGFLILVSGFYHVYSSIEFKPPDNKMCRDYAVKTWKQIVVRGRPNDRASSGAILSSAHTCCDDCMWDKETSYTGGTFYLQAGDHLHTEISGMGLVNFQTESSYFGLMLMGDRSL